MSAANFSIIDIPSEASASAVVNFLSKEENMRKPRIIVAVVVVLFLIGCQAPKIRLFPSAADPLQEYTLAGTEKGKVLVISIRGTI